MMRRLLLVSSFWMIASLGLWAGPARAADIMLAENGASACQIILPDASPTPEIADGLAQAARLIQTAFKANGMDVAVVAESRRDAGKPGIYLGDTAFAKANGVQLSGLAGWGYVQKVAGGNVIIAGRDQAAPPMDDGSTTGRTGWTRLGTVKGVADFLRQYAGVRFLYPDLPHKQALATAAAIDLLNSPAIEFLKTLTIAVPADLNVRKIPCIEYNQGYPPRASFYDLANNRFPLVDVVFGCHTYGRAVPVAKYYDTHPEYFALIGKQRVKDDQYCISNPEFQELMYQDMIGWLNKGYDVVDLGQSDGFRPCQCENCAKLFNTTDWSEKIWLFHRNLAERVLKSHPTKRVTIMSYIQTAQPPKSFKEFPANVRIMLCGTNEEDIAPWLSCKVPGGFVCYLYNWCANMGSRYTPMRTPLFIESQARRLAKYRVQGIYRDGTGQLFGLEGPVYYTMGRMFDDPENNQAKDLVIEFCGAAFGKSAPAMLRFYDQLYHGIELYSDYLGTRCPAWTYNNIYGQRKKSINDPYQLLGFLYTPALLTALDRELSQAEKLSDSDKVTVRLALVRREFEYVKSLATVVHLTHAYEIQPDQYSRDRLCDAIDARNALIAGYYDAKGRPKPTEPWSFVLFPPPAHTIEHMKIAKNDYQAPFESTSLNWDTKAMRAAPLPGAKRLAVKPAQGAVTLEAPQWESANSDTLGGLPYNTAVSRKTTLRALYDSTCLYLRVESELPSALMKSPAAVGRDGALEKTESLDICLAPLPGKEIFYRFRVGLQPQAKYDAAIGFITDPMDPRFGKDDPSWNGDWEYDSRLDAKKNRWVALVRIPFKSLDVAPPAVGTAWRGNVGRIHFPAPNQVESSIWAAVPGTRSMEDRAAFGEIVFESAAGSGAAAAGATRVRELREKLYKSTFEIPADWKNLADPLPLTGWTFRTDPLEQGLKESWFNADAATGWSPIAVPAFWAETEVGNYQGYGWYRVAFKAPAEWKGRAVRLLFGGVDEQAWIYVNGKLVGEHTLVATKQDIGTLCESPFTVDVPPDALKYGAENTLVVRVHNGIANGGIWRSVLAQATQPK